MIEVNHLHKYFGDQHILKDISFDVKAGETIAVIGPSGSGKSTLIRCLNLLEKPTQGTIKIGDMFIEAPHFPKKTVYELRKHVGMVFQSFNLFPHLTALKNVAQGLMTVQKKDKATAFEESMHYLSKVGLAEKADHYPSQLSGGQQQRVAIARSLAMQPQVILMDEPTSALDPELVQEVLAVIKEVTKEQVTSMIVTHELNFAKDVSSRVMFMDQGRIIECATPNELFFSPKQERTMMFLEKFAAMSVHDFSI
ncbi:amino acid ABC transporter ATP-binding protein [Neisseria sp. Ec49-e6-T10]|uniref:amino acid ABC transporter ATP-binding protein n=1 Tax=Neisseria sp. Ec49-e6-T10 TaxID=3140744 RepID=UPI003EBCB0E7